MSNIGNKIKKSNNYKTEINTPMTMNDNSSILFKR
jgi:hypothetical protein